MRKHTIMTTAAFILFSNLTFAISPEEVLADEQNAKTYADGVVIRKGTIGATLANAKAFDAITSREELKKMHEDQISLIPALEHVGFFDFVKPIELLSMDHREEGRIWIAMLYFSLHPNQITPEVRSLLEEIRCGASAWLKEEMANLIGNLCL
jgi:hypothetical protein